MPDHQTLEIYLPATDPGNTTYGLVPSGPAVPGNSSLAVRFEQEVWYNRYWRKEVIASVSPGLLDRNILIGFSKSGCGALNIAIENPTLFDSVVIFDAPLSRREVPPWNTASFYNQRTWEEDLPETRIHEIARLSESTSILHIGGRAFNGEHQVFQERCDAAGIKCEYLNRHEYAHSWTSGWVREGVGRASGALDVGGQSQDHSIN